MSEDSRPETPPASGQETGARLVIRFGGQSISVSGQSGDVDRISLGRDKSNTLVAAQKFVSRKHATIEFVRDRFIITDMSANGTYIQPAGKELLHLHGAKVFLEGEGILSLGLHLDKPEALRIQYVFE